MATQTGSIYINGTPPANMKLRVQDEDIQKQETPDIALKNLAKASDHILFETRNIFPLDFWPDTLRIALNQLEIIYRNDPFSKYVYPIPINKVLTVRVHKGLFFAEMEIEVEGHEQNPSHIKYLSKADADEASQIILGLRVAHGEHINLQGIPKNKLIERVKQVAASQKTS